MSVLPVREAGTTPVHDTRAPRRSPSPLHGSGSGPRTKPAAPAYGEPSRAHARVRRTGRAATEYAEPSRAHARVRRSEPAAYAEPSPPHRARRDRSRRTEYPKGA
ncbi:hypothetical protein DEJ43_33485 [Streptomyces venezuelae ATCC 10712]|nr:hypothetical protein vnz_32945 [Streptomyces venezuelae]QES02704.1 hypothetical protein DEJ43_33485 [Streptomyces venezuelae ATCC 10712]